MELLELVQSSGEQLFAFIHICKKIDSVAGLNLSICYTTLLAPLLWFHAEALPSNSYFYSLHIRLPVQRIEGMGAARGGFDNG